MVQALINPNNIFGLAKQKLHEIKPNATAVPSSGQNSANLPTMLEAYSKTSKSQLINSDHHFMPGLRTKMISDAEFNQAPMKGGSRLRSKTVAILKGISIN